MDTLRVHTKGGEPPHLLLKLGLELGLHLGVVFLVELVHLLGVGQLHVEAHAPGARRPTVTVGALKIHYLGTQKQSLQLNMVNTVIIVFTAGPA